MRVIWIRHEGLVELKVHVGGGVVGGVLGLLTLNQLKALKTDSGRARALELARIL